MTLIDQNDFILNLVMEQARELRNVQVALNAAMNPTGMKAEFETALISLAPIEKKLREHQTEMLFSGLAPLEQKIVKGPIIPATLNEVSINSQISLIMAQEKQRAKQKCMDHLKVQKGLQKNLRDIVQTMRRGHGDDFSYQTPSFDSGTSDCSDDLRSESNAVFNFKDQSQLVTIDESSNDSSNQLADNELNYTLGKKYNSSVFDTSFGQ